MVLNNFEFNELYQDVFTTKARYIYSWGGRGRGGSHFVTDYALFLITQPRYFRAVFMREVFADIRTSLYKDFLDRIDEKSERDGVNYSNLFKINDSRMSITYIPTGNTIISKGFKKSSGKQSAKLKSLAGCTHVFIEEAEEVGYDDFTQLDASLRTTKSDVQVVMVFNPPHKNHWIITENYNLEDSGYEGYYRATLKKTAKENVLSIFSTYKDNIENINQKTIRIFENYQETNIEYYRIMIQGLVSEGKKGRVYKNWKAITELEFWEVDAPIVCGLDFGYSNDPNGFILTKRTGNKLYLHEVFYEGGLSNQEIAEKIKQCGIKGELIYCDHEPKSEKELKREGLNVVQAMKGQGSVLAGIKLMHSLEVFATESSKNLWNEYDKYCWALNLNKEPTDTPIDKYNHLLDPVRYTQYIKPQPQETTWESAKTNKNMYSNQNFM